MLMVPLGAQCRESLTGTLIGKSFKVAVRVAVPPLLEETLVAVIL